MPSKIGYVGTGTQGVIILAGSFTISGGSVAQYVVGNTGLNTGTGVMFIGVNVTTAVPIKVDSDGTVFVSGGGGGVQYTRDTTAIGATGTGTIVLGINSTTLRGIKVTADGTVFVTNAGTQVISGTVTAVPSNTGTIANVLTVGTMLGTLSISGTVDGTFGAGQAYIVGETSIGATGTGTLFIGVNATTARAIKLTADGTLFVTNAGTQVISGTVTAIPSNTGTVANVLTVGTLLGTVLMSQSGTGNVTIAGTPTVTASQGGTWNIATVSTLLGTVAVTAAGVTIASITTGTVTALPSGTQTVVVVSPFGTVTNVLSVGTVLGTVLMSQSGTGNVTIAGLPIPVYQTHIGTQWNSGLVTITTSAAGVGGILKTSAANTVYVTDVLASVDVPMNLQLRSATTVLSIVYLATKGGFTMALRTPMVCTTAQSFTFIPSLSGSASVWAGGYTVT